VRLSIEKAVGLVVAIAVGLIMAVAVSLRARSQTPVLIAAVGWLLAETPLGLGVALASSPCGPSGGGILQATPGCPVQAIHVVSATLGFGSFVSLLAGCIGGFAYVETGTLVGRRTFRFGLLIAVALVLAWSFAALELPRPVAID
jgi:hypothetical protein